MSATASPTLASVVPKFVSKLLSEWSAEEVRVSHFIVLVVVSPAINRQDFIFAPLSGCLTQSMNNLYRWQEILIGMTLQKLVEQIYYRSHVIKKASLLYSGTGGPSSSGASSSLHFLLWSEWK